MQLTALTPIGGTTMESILPVLVLGLRSPATVVSVHSFRALGGTNGGKIKELAHYIPEHG